MLIVIQGPKKSGKTTLAIYLQQMVPNLHVYDNINPHLVDSLVDEIRELSRTENVLVTTIQSWPYPSDFVWYLQRLFPGSTRIPGPIF